MSDVERRAGTGFALLFRRDERPDASAILAALDKCQTPAQSAHVDTGAGVAEVVARGLTFDVDGLAPAVRCEIPTPESSHGFADLAGLDGLEPVRLYPGHHLSGGLALPPVVRTMAALAAELSTVLPVVAIVWLPANTATETGVFAHTVLAWLAGGAFPAHSFTALSALADGTVVSRGLAHFVQQEISVSNRPSSKPEATLRLAAHVVDRLVQEGRIEMATQLQIRGETFCAEPAQQGTRVLVWPAS
ncbi:hypothetical protein [Novosphingobium sp. M1R2S20]|uniref:FtsZ family protein n=1 Tax=Novosphingobium rhizovicinum TaxID=3228928 RepID=A0ABV3R740_9SPHN